MWWNRCRLAVVGALLGIGLGLALWQPLSSEDLMDWALDLRAQPWTVGALVALQTALHALALPGSLMLWVFAPLFRPEVAAALLTIGSVSGALAAYVLARWAGADWKPGRRTEPVMAFLSRRRDFATQLILRILPGFPHSVLNYGAGVLGLPLRAFLAAATLGLSIKWFVYSEAVHTLVASGLGEEPLGLQTVAPLIVLAVMLMLGIALRKWLSRSGQADG